MSHSETNLKSSINDDGLLLHRYKACEYSYYIWNTYQNKYLTKKLYVYNIQYLQNLYTWLGLSLYRLMIPNTLQIYLHVFVFILDHLLLKTINTNGSLIETIKQWILLTMSLWFDTCISSSGTVSLVSAVATSAWLLKISLFSWRAVKGSLQRHSVIAHHTGQSLQHQSDSEKRCYH